MATFVENKKVRFNYEILETFDAGLELFGGEVKAVRKKQMSLEGSHVVVRGGEAYLVGATIALYQPNNDDSKYDPDRNRRLLLAKKELKELIGKSEQRGLTLVPISVYNKRRYLKLSIGLVRGKKKFDKRETIKKREADREVRRSLKDN
jgi:SsrA-binding protein